MTVFFHHPGEPLPDFLMKFKTGWIVFEDVPVTILFIIGFQTNF